MVKTSEVPCFGQAARRRHPATSRRAAAGGMQLFRNKASLRASGEPGRAGPPHRHGLDVKRGRAGSASSFAQVLKVYVQVLPAFVSIPNRPREGKPGKGPAGSGRSGQRFESSESEPAVWRAAGGVLVSTGASRRRLIRLGPTAGAPARPRTRAKVRRAKGLVRSRRPTGEAEHLCPSVLRAVS